MEYQGMEVLLVEDDPDDLQLTLHALQEAHFNPISVSRDGGEALDHFYRRGTRAGREDVRRAPGN